MSETQYKALSCEYVAKKLTEYAKNNIKLLIIAHRNPDGDAVGSAFALKLIYKALGGSAVCVSPNEIPEYLKFLMKEQSTLIFNAETEYDKIIAVDTASPSQMGEIEFLSEKTELLIDHHKSYTEYCDTYREEDASAAGELIYKIYDLLVENGKIERNTEIARLIYAAISADTGSFQYSNTTGTTHKVAAKLINEINSDDGGISTAEIARLLHNSKSLKSLKAQKVCIDFLNITDDGKIGYVILEKKKIKAQELEMDDFSTAIDVPRCVEGVLLAFVLKESTETDINGNRIYKLSTRSSCNVSVGEICKKFGGGGHDKAAGGSVAAKNAKQAADMVLKAFKEALEKS